MFGLKYVIKVEYKNGEVAYFKTASVLAKELGCTCQGVIYLMNRIQEQGDIAINRSTIMYSNGIKNIIRIENPNFMLDGEKIVGIE